MANITLNAHEVTGRTLKTRDSIFNSTSRRFVDLSSGNNQGVGNFYEPWLTLQKAFDSVTNGNEIIMSGSATVGGVVTMTGKSNISLRGDRASKYTGNVTFSNCTNVHVDADIAGNLTFSDCQDIFIYSGRNLTNLQIDRVKGSVHITGNVPCEVAFNGTGGAPLPDVHLFDNIGPNMQVTCLAGFTGTITTRNSILSLFRNLFNTAGPVTVRLVNSFKSNYQLPDFQNTFTIYRDTDSSIDVNDPNGLNASKTPTSQAVVNFLDANLPSGLNEEVLHLCSSGVNTMLIETSKAIYTVSGNNNNYSVYNGISRTTGNPQLFGAKNPHRIRFIDKQGGVVKGCLTNYSATLILFTDGELWGFGRNDSGQLGLGDTTARNLPVLLKTGVDKILSTEDASSYSFTDATLLIQDTSGWVWATGKNSNGVMGLGDATARSSWTRLDWIGQNPIGVWLVGTTYGSLFAQMSNGTIKAVGYNASGQLGVGNTTSITTPVTVNGNWMGGATHPVITVVGGAGYFDSSASNAASILMLYNNAGTKVLKACGNNNWGQLGTGNTNNLSTPATVTIPGGISQISTIGGVAYAAFALNSSGVLYGWGRNETGALGLGTTTNVSTPTQIRTGVAEILRPVYSSHTFSYQVGAFIRDTSGYCWAAGYNENGQLGIGNTTTAITTFTRVIMDKPIKMVGQFCPSGDSRSACTVFATDDNELWCCGDNGNYGIATDNTGDVASPVKIFYK